MRLSNQALGALMMALQKSLLEQTDIVPVLQDFDFVDTPDGLAVNNPPVVNTASFPENEEEGSAVFRAYLDELDKGA
tara:strand:+ start:1118 stop:1348 length:231 start_codon:yes stop_codon:yes gene_type:complete